MAGQSSEEKDRNMASSSAGLCFSDVSSSNPNIEAQLVNQMQSYNTNTEIYNLTTGMGMIGFSTSKNLQQNGTTAASCSDSGIWKGFLGKLANHHHYGVVPSTSRTLNENDSYPHEFTNENFMDATGSLSVAWNESRLLADHPEHQSSSLRCVFPCQENQRPSQGLSLSLCSSNPSTIVGLQPYELRQHGDVRLDPVISSRDGYFEKSMNIQQQQIMQDELLENATHVPYQGHLENIRQSKYLVATQELLNEFCDLGTKQTDPQTKAQFHKTSYDKLQEDRDNASCSSLNLLELQKRKTKLLQMLQEVDVRYKHYCEQMKSVVSSFEAVGGNGSATVYSSLASKAMSRHFRCLRDGILGQIKVTRKAMGEKGTAASPGMSRGETPRLRILDQTLRQQKALQQMNMIETHPWRPQRGLPERSVSILRAWLFEHFLHPYPSDVDKIILARQTCLSRSQVSNWFINARVRLWKPMVEEMYLEETKEEENSMDFSDGDLITATQLDQKNKSQTRSEDQKPTPDQLARLESQGLQCDGKRVRNSLVGDETNNFQHQQFHHHHPLQRQQSGGFGRVSNSFGHGAIELDFSSSQVHHSPDGGGVSYSNHTLNHQSYGGHGVSLTLGLEQHGGRNGVNVAFSPPSNSSLVFSKYPIPEDNHPVQYSILDAEGQNFQYRNLMGSQLLHDLAG